MNIFSSPLALPYTVVPLYLILFIDWFFKKWGSPSPCAGHALAWLRLYNTPKIDYATSGNKKKEQ